MKNIFKFMGIALMATTLMVGCNNDDPEDDPIDTTPVNPNPPAGTISVTWDGQAQTIGDVIAKADNEYFSVQSGDAPYVLLLDACKGVDANGDVIFPEFITAFASQGTQLIPNQSYGPFSVQYSNGQVDNNAYLSDLIATEVYETAGIEMSQSLYGDYQFYTANAQPTFGAFDATKLTVDCELNYKFYSFGPVISTLQDFSFDPASAGIDTTGMVVNGQLVDTNLYYAYYQAYMQAYNQAGSAAIEAAPKKDMVMKLTNYKFTAGVIE